MVQEYIIKTNNGGNNKMFKTGLSGIFAASLELSRQGLISIMQINIFDKTSSVVIDNSVIDYNDYTQLANDITDEDIIFKITSLPDVGSMYKGNEILLIGSEFTQKDINDQNINYEIYYFRFAW